MKHTFAVWWALYGRWRRRHEIYDWETNDPELYGPRETHVRLLNRWPEMSRLPKHPRHARRG
jgi:hypothetical protein